MKSGLFFGLVASALLVAACDRPAADRDRDMTQQTDPTYQGEMAQQTEQAGTPEAAGTSGVIDSRPGAMDHDQAITSEVEANLLAFPQLEQDVANGRVDVETSGGTVTLAGTLGSEAERETAISVAWSVEGVTRVNDQLSVE